MNTYAPIETPIGRLFVAFNGRRISAVGRTPGSVEASLRARFSGPVRAASALLEPLARTVSEWLQGHDRAAPDFELGGVPAFDAAVLRTVLEIPRGEVRSYGWVAREG